MKIKLLIDTMHNGVSKKKGDVLDVIDRNADKWISKGWGEPIKKKEAKPKKETKELKIDSKETKDEAK
jgi:hypothetical protein